MGGGFTTPPLSQTSDSSRAASVSNSTSEDAAIPSRSITGRRLRTLAAASSYAAAPDPPCIRISRRRRSARLEASAKSALLGKDTTAVFGPASVGGPPSAAPEGVHSAQSVTDPFQTQV